MKKTMLGLAILMGCGTSEPSGPETLPDLTVPPAPENGLQVITPIFEPILPGMDYEICTWTDAIFDKQTDIRSTLAFQNEPPGHHAILFYTTDKQPAGTQRVCTDTDMASFRLVSGGGSEGELNEAPGDLVYRIPAGAQLVINHHYLNASDQTLRGQALINVNFADPGNYIPSGNMAIVDTNIQVPVGESTYNIECTIDRQMKLWYFIPHMHRWGKHINVDVTAAGTTQRMFDLDWDDSYTFHPPEKRMDPAAPMVLNPGDKVAVQCQWNNDTDKTLGFGFEMCVAFGQFVDDTGIGSAACNAGTWLPF